MTFTLSPATPADVPGIVDTWLAANSQSEIVQKYLKTPVGYDYLATCYTRSIEEDRDEVMIMAEEIEGGGRRVGALAKLILEKGGRPPSAWEERWRAELPESMPTEVMEAFWGPISRQRVAIVEGRTHRFLEVMATHPDYQKRGLASVILKWACERADREGVEVYLDASVMGRPLYEKFDFVARMEKKDPEAKSDPMQRSPKAA